MDAHYAAGDPDPIAVSRLDPALETPPGASAERRLHGRAHAYWRSLVGAQRFPLIEDLDLAGVPRLAETSVLFGVDPADGQLEINLVGASIRVAWEGPESAMARLIAQVRLRLSVLTAHGKPIGFEAELAGDGAGDTAYRGILLPFGRTGETVDFVLMVVNWKERADAARDPALLAASLYAAEKRPRCFGDTPWSGIGLPDEVTPSATSIDQKLAAARTWAALAEAEGAQRRERANKAMAAAYAYLVSTDDLSPLAVTDAVFGPGADRRLRCHRAATLRYARRLCLSPELLHDLLDDLGGVAEVAAMERQVRRSGHLLRARYLDHFLLTEPVRPQDRMLSPWRGRDAEPIAVEHVHDHRVAQAAKD